MEGYFPKKHDKYILFALKTIPCKICKVDMVVKPKGHYETFPYWTGDNFDAQVKKANIRVCSKLEIDDEFICTQCVREGKSYFTCWLCKEENSTYEIQVTIGIYKPSLLCKNCYKNVSAKEWDEACKNIEIEHRYEEWG